MDYGTATENIIPVLDHSVALSIASAQSPVMRQASKRGYLSFHISPFGRKTGRLCPLFCEMCGFMEGPSGFGGRMPRGEGLAKKGEKTLKKGYGARLLSGGDACDVRSAFCRSRLSSSSPAPATLSFLLPSPPLLASVPQIRTVLP